MSVVAALLEGLIDYAGLDPPAGLDRAPVMGKCACCRRGRQQKWNRLLLVHAAKEEMEASRSL